ncbi:precorrin-2 C(20)-methyltransferase [Cytophagaceae bacterium DM2B3-1]|uniref:Precorrin-2 C(20)-methyltransferase n=1 Tax=Xanthocytophaga flava TaxID=3048013 RepID=A0ABT7CWE3_9BACT|nr:precorrin-2 C(20)-methyltransferase [Xanthocytophaga flavus]MDJ1498040.1 precorrin-2 C(20)-methyltransferase [Xanthocytophaga flavus]
MKKGKIYGVSLGPGDPDLITVKGLRLLQTVDRIYYPGSVTEEGTTTSYSLPILKAYDLDENKLTGMFLKMSDNRDEAQQTYANTFQQMLTDYQNGLQIAFVSEGDISFYSTFSYLLTYIQQHQLEVEIVAGVPSFLLGAAEHQIPLALLTEKIVVLPRTSNVLQLQQYLSDFETVILIKVRSILQEIIPVIQQQAVMLFYCERLGTAQQFISTSLEEIMNRDIPYFSLLILKKQL